MLNIIKIMELTITTTLFLVGCGVGINSSYDNSGKILVEKLSDSEKYVVNGTTYKKYSKEEDKMADINKNFNNIYFI